MSIDQLLAKVGIKCHIMHLSADAWEYDHDYMSHVAVAVGATTQDSIASL